MYHRAARPEDLLEILQLYREYNQGEPLSLSLGLPERHLETNLAIIASFKRLINSSCVLLCCEGTSVLGMAVHYPMPCLPRTQEDILNLTWWQGYPDLAPAIILSDRAVECCSLAVQYRTVMNTPWLNDKVNLILSSLSLWSQHGLRNWDIDSWDFLVTWLRGQGPVLPLHRAPGHRPRRQRSGGGPGPRDGDTDREGAGSLCGLQSGDRGHSQGSPVEAVEETGAQGHHLDTAGAILHRS